MIVVDYSAIPLPGKQAEFVAVTKEQVANLDQRWPTSSPRMVTADLTDGRVHIITMRATLAESEASVAEMQADAHTQALMQKRASLIVPGSSRFAYSRVL